MGLLEDAARLLTLARSAPELAAGLFADPRRGIRYADDLPSAAAAPAAAAGAAGTIEIQDVLRPWVVIRWPADLPIPPGYVSFAGALGVGQFQPPGGAGAGAVTFVPESSPAAGLIRQSAEQAAEAAAFRSLREAQREERRAAGLERLAPRVTPGAGPPFGGRPSRPSRPSRTPRTPRPPRTPRTPRTNGTKNARTQTPCRRKNSLGQCVAPGGCTPSATIPEPNVGHSSCNWAPVDSCGNCVQAGCTGPAAALLKPFLELLPKYWSQQGVALAQQVRKEQASAARVLRRFATLPARSPGAAAIAPTSYTVDPRANVGGCACQDWPGWIICPNCSGTSRCRCGGTCIAFPASVNNCAG